jgi:hypothetical protein
LIKKRKKRISYRWYPRNSVIVGQGRVLFGNAMAREATMKKVSACKKKVQGFPHFFVIPDFQLSNSLFLMYVLYLLVP